MDWFNPFEGSEGGGGGSGTDNYNELINKPSINNVVLLGNKTEDDLGLQKKISSSNKISSDNVNDSGAQNLFTNTAEKQIWNAKQDAIQNLQDIQNGAALGATSLQPSNVKSTYSSTGTDPVNGTAIAAALGTLDVESVGGAGKYISAISETDGKISATAETMDSTPTSNSTKAVTSDGIYEYVNSSVATNTAYFIGTFASVEELEEYSGIITNNDYAFVTSTDSSGNTLYNRYKYNGSTHTWSFEYALNNSSFTSAQWATIQSGLTSSDKTKLDGIQSGANKTIVDAAMSSSSTNPVQNKVVNTALAGKQDTLTFDSTPTQSSTNPVTSAGIYTDQARQDALEAQDRAALIEVVDNGAKNLLQNSLSSGTVNGITYTINADGSITTTAGTASGGNSNLVIYFDLEPGVYVVSGCPNGGSSTTYRAQVLDNTTSTSVALVTDSTTGEEFEVVSGHEYAWRFRVQENKSIPDATFYPMICSKAEWDISHAYVPFGKTNAELTVENASQQSEIDYAINAGAKNLASKNSGSGTNSTAIPKTPITLPVGDYICSFSASSYSGNAAFELWDAGNSQQYVKELTVAGSNSFKFTVTGNMSVAKYSLYVNNATISDFMIRPAAISDTTYQPYARSNPSLTAEMDVVANAGAKNDFDIENLIKSAVSENATYSLTGYSLAASSNGRYARVSIPYKFKAGTTVFSTVVSEYSISGATICIRFATQSSSFGPIANEIEITNNGQYQREITVNADTDGFVIYYMNSSPDTYVNSAVFTNNMIRPAAITDPTFQPYAPTNAKLQETKQDKLSSVDRDVIRSLVYGNGFDLAPTSENQINLNDLMTPGKYRIQSAVETDYVTNKPERRAAGIVVEVASSTGYIRQTWLPSLSANEANYFCIRHYRSSGSGAANGWSAWYKYEGTVMT